MEQTSYAVAGQSSSPVRQKVNPWKTDMGHLHSPPPKTGQSAARMEQKTYAVAGQSSSPRRKTANPWKTDAQSYPATFCDDSTEHFPLLSDHRPSKKEQKLQKQMPTWGQKVNFGKDVPGLEVVVSPPSPQFADDLSASGQGQNESRVQKEGQKEGPKEGPKNKRGGRGGLTWGASSGPSKTGPSQEKQD